VTPHRPLPGAAAALSLLFAAGAALAEEPVPPQSEPKETVIPVPVPAPSGLLLAWKPMILTVRLDTGTGSKFGSDKLQPLRGLARYTVMAKEGTPFFGRFELEGGQFETDTQNLNVGSKGYDLTGRVMGGAATRLFPGVLFVAAVGGITRYQHGSAVGGAPTIGQFGVVANAEIEYRFHPVITLSVMGEAAVAPFPYSADKNLGDLSDASEVRGRIQVSFDLTTNVALDVGYDFTRWHSTFVSSTILGNPNPDQALVAEAREYAFTFGARWKF
jgi:hypothetical protein